MSYNFQLLFLIYKCTGLPRRTDWFVLTPLDAAWSRIRITGPVYPDPITSRGYLYPSNISFEQARIHTVANVARAIVRNFIKYKKKRTLLAQYINLSICLQLSQIITNEQTPTVSYVSLSKYTQDTRVCSLYLSYNDFNTKPIKLRVDYRSDMAIATLTIDQL